MSHTIVEIIQPAVSNVIDCRVTVKTDSGPIGVRTYAFENDVPFDEIIKRIGVALTRDVKIVLRAPYGSQLRRTALRSVEADNVVLDSDSPGRESLNVDVWELERTRRKLERIYTKDVFGQ